MTATPGPLDWRRLVDMSAAYAERHHILPIQVTATEVVVATAEPYVTDWVAEFFALAKSVRTAQKAGTPSGVANFEQLVEMGRAQKPLDANDQRASDIHLEPRREQGVIRFRIDGVLHPVYQVPMGVLGAMTARIKLLARMDVMEKRRPQDGRIKTRRSQPAGGPGAAEEVEMRLSTLPTAFGEKMVMRILTLTTPSRTWMHSDFLSMTPGDGRSCSVVPMALCW